MLSVTPPTSAAPIPHLPDEIIMKIMRTVPATSIAPLSLVCRRFDSLTLTPEVLRSQAHALQLPVPQITLDTDLRTRLAARKAIAELAVYRLDEPSPFIVADLARTRWMARNKAERATSRV